MAFVRFELLYSLKHVQSEFQTLSSGCFKLVGTEILGLLHTFYGAHCG